MAAKQCENNESIAVYIVEIPAKEQNTPEVNKAKHKEIENLVKFDVFEEVDDYGKKIGSRWMVTQKEKADGQNSQVKGRIVAKRISRRREATVRFANIIERIIKNVFCSGS